jgi:hypothetical protein
MFQRLRQRAGASNTILTIDSRSRDFSETKTAAVFAHWRAGRPASGFLHRMIQNPNLYKGTGAGFNPEILSV